MIIEALVYGKEKTKEEILGSALASSLSCDLRIISTRVSDEAANFNGHNIYFHSIESSFDYGECMNLLIKQSQADVIFFPDLDSKLIGGVEECADGFLAEKNTPSVILMYQGDGKKGHAKCKRRLSNALFSRNYLLRRQLLFVHGPYKYKNAINACFLSDVLRWPTRVSHIEPTPYVETQSRVALSNEEQGYLIGHKMGPLWPLGLIAVKLKHRQFSFKIASQGKRIYLQSNYYYPDNIKDSWPALIISSIALVGFAVQLVLTFIVTFTETQYIPIWAALGFLILFAVAFAFSVSKVDRKRVLFLTLATSFCCSLASLIALLSLNCSLYLSLFAAALGGTVIMGLEHCLAAKPQLRK